MGTLDLYKELKWILQGRVRRDADMRRYTSIGVGGPARLMAFPRSEEELAWTLALLHELKRKYVVIGRGTNLLVRDGGLDEVVLNLSRGFKKLKTLRSGEVAAGAGLELPRLARALARRGLAGAEWMGGVPGTLGGAVRMNAGAFGSDVKTILRSVRLMNKKGEARETSAEELGLAYRSSAIPLSDIVIEARMAFRKDRRRSIEKRMADLAEKRRAAQPRGRSAGSVFRNPEGDSAGRLLESVGMKGMVRGGARVSEKHANFILTSPGATAADVEALISLGRRRVRERWGVVLEPEIRILGRRSSQ